MHLLIVLYLHDISYMLPWPAVLSLSKTKKKVFYTPLGLMS